MARASRKPYTYHPTFISKSFSFDTPGIGLAATVDVGTVPAGCLISSTLVRIRTAFNAATTNVIIVGTSADSDMLIEAFDVDESTTETTESARNAGTVFTVDTPVYVQYTQTGTAATTGAADVIVKFIHRIED